jgi:hypothetical protein
MLGLPWNLLCSRQPLLHQMIPILVRVKPHHHIALSSSSLHRSSHPQHNHSRRACPSPEPSAEPVNQKCKPGVNWVIGEGKDIVRQGNLVGNLSFPRVRSSSRARYSFTVGMIKFLPDCRGTRFTLRQSVVTTVIRNILLNFQTMAGRSLCTNLQCG